MQRLFHILCFVIVTCALFVAGSAVHGQCTIGAGFDLDHDPGKVDWWECRALAVFNAGDGEKLYAGHAVGGEHLRAWADGRWTNIPGAPSLITALYVWNNELYIGTAGQLWKWDGATFSLIASFAHTSATPIVYAMHVFDLETNPSSPDGSSVLAVGGHFTSVNGLNTDSLAFWDGSSWWSASNVREPVHALYSDVTGPLGVGEIETIKIGSASGIDNMFSNDPTRTVNAQNDTGGQVRAIAFFDNFLCHGGDYGENVPQLGFIVNGTVNAMQVWDDGSGEKLYVAGDFTSYGGGGIHRGVIIVDAAGTTYPVGFGTGVDSAGERINAMAVFQEAPAHGPSMYFGGEFAYNDGTNTYYDFVRLGCDVPEPTVVSSDWELTNTFHLADAIAAHYSEFDDALYVGRRNSTYGPKGLYRLEMDDTLTPIWTGDDVAGVEIDVNGNIYTSDDFTGPVYRVDQGTTSRYIWVQGWHSGDDDPIGLAIAPPNASGWLSPGDAFMVDRGSGGLDEIWQWSTLSPEGETVLHADNGTLENPIDITCSDTQLWICDNEGGNPGKVYEVLSNGSVSVINLSETVESPAGIAYMPSMQQLFVLDDAGGGGLARIISIDPQTGSVATVITGFSFTGGTTYASLDVTDDGQRLYVTDGAAGRVYEFTSTTPCPPGDATGDQITNSSDRILIGNDFGCDDQSTCDCAGDVNGDCQTTLADLGIVMSNWNLACPDGVFNNSPSLNVTVDVYETPWPETPPDSGVYYTIDLKVTSTTGDEWTAAESTASIVADGTFWDDPSGASIPLPDIWIQPGMMNLRYDSYYQAPASPAETLLLVPNYVNNPQLRHAAWSDSPDGDTAGPYIVARYTVRLDDAEAAEPLLLVETDTGDPYLTITGNMTTVEGGGTLVPFSITIYSTRDCLSDLSGDGNVTVGDLSIILNALDNETDEGDVDNDGDTDRDDVAIFAAGYTCPNEPMITGGPVSHSGVIVDNTSGNTDPNVVFDGGVTHHTVDVAINLGDDFWTTSQVLCTLTEPGYSIFQHPRSFGNPDLAPFTFEIETLDSFAAAFDTFLTIPGAVVDPSATIFFADDIVSTATQYGSTLGTITPRVGVTGTIARLTIIAPDPTQSIELIPAGARGPNQIVIGSVVGDSTVASTLAARYPFDFDIVVTELPVQCPADLANDDGVIDVFDLFVLLGNWGSGNSGAELAPDTNIVDVFDLFVLLSAWGACD